MSNSTEFRRISDYNDWEPFGKGGRGTTYRSKKDPSILLKMDNRGDEKVVREEFELSMQVASLGISTPKVYELITDGKMYGYTAQLIKGKKSICRIISEDLSRMDEMAKLFADRSRAFHSTPCDSTSFKSMKQFTLERLGANKYLKDSTREAILDELRSIPETGTCLLGDFHFGNLITTGDNDYWIDLGEFSYGNPAFDLARFGFSLELPSPVTKNLFHLDKTQVADFYDRFLGYYTESIVSASEKEEFMRQLKAAGLASRLGVIMNAPLAIIFLPRLQRYRGDKPSSRLAIIWKLICGKKLY